MSIADEIIVRTSIVQIIDTVANSIAGAHDLAQDNLVEISCA